MSDQWQSHLIFWMEKKGFNMKSLSRQAGLGETFIRDALKRGRRPYTENMVKIADALGISLGDLLEGSPSDDLAQDEAELVHHARRLSPAHRKALIQLARSLDAGRQTEETAGSRHSGDDK